MAVVDERNHDELGRHLHQLVRSVPGLVPAAILCCSCAGEGRTSEPTQTTSANTAVLPGESTQGAQFRIMVDCLRTNGLTVEVGVDNRSFRIPPGQGEVQDEIGLCEDRLKRLGLGDRPMTTDELVADYRRLQDLMACVRRQGFNPGELVSKQTFIDARADLNPYPGLTALLASISNAAYTSLVSACPQFND